MLLLRPFLAFAVRQLRPGRLRLAILKFNNSRR